MIVINLNGGLGNQMFCYAFGRYLSHVNKCTVALDTSFLENSPDAITKRNYELNIFPNLSIPIINNSQKKIIINYRTNKIYQAYNRFRKIIKLPSAYTHSVQTWEKPFMLEELLNVKTNIHFLSGFWQNEYYFAPIADNIRQEFSFPERISAENQLLITEINSCNSVSLHIRRGDYITEKTASEWLNVCSIDYYERAMQRIADEVSNPTFFIFSDEIDWVKENLVIPYPHLYVDHNSGATAYEDMRLMSLCRHNIIANSTFSWWGAWLNNNPTKMVIAPELWLEKLHLTGDMMVPKNWIKL